MKRELCLVLSGIALTISMYGLTGCSQQETPSAKAYFKGTVSPELNQQVLEGRVREFFDWYTTNVDSLVNIQLVDNSGVEDTGLYKVNFDSTRAYLDILSASGLFTHNYIDDKDAYFRLCDSKIREDSVRTATPYGFDADLILLSQEYEEDITNFDEAVFSNYTETENGASIDVTIVYTLRIDFIIQADRLLIDKIDVVMPDEHDAGTASEVTGH
ncbi:hypothetical protein [Chitinophaga rhizophila]|uniref:Lipoprotein n=1 Tax=Chitinophaga rhizophila TaxID=2866212 RepID=A0ABS7GCY4_9BACT|nr:hypothetical protein [Chitinophaga rhizophila]MBW8685533.1 hypothetical protein [Chitinophaga rhizophila]